MTFKKRHIEGLTATAPTVLGTVGLGATYGRVVGFTARNFADSTKAAAGTDAAEVIELKDADGFIFYLDAADADYKTAAVNRTIIRDDTITGLTGHSVVDSTGATQVTANVISDTPVVRGPITVTIRNCSTATDYFSLDLVVEI